MHNIWNPPESNSLSTQALNIKYSPLTVSTILGQEETYTYQEYVTTETLVLVVGTLKFTT